MRPWDLQENTEAGAEYSPGIYKVQEPRMTDNILSFLIGLAVGLVFWKPAYRIGEMAYEAIKERLK